MPPAQGHPSDAELQAYSLGKLNAQRATEIESYLAEHPECVAILDATEDDDVARHLRGAGEFPTENCWHPEAATVSPDAGEGASVPSSSTTPPDHGPTGPSATTDHTFKGLTDHPRYRVLRKLGEGGMGAVYLAEHRIMKRPVALKLIRTSALAHPHAVERFRREVRAAARLNHPNIVTAYDAEEAGGTHFLAMEYVEGVSLSDWLAQHPALPAAEVCEYVCQAALGLQYAHERGMIHRDLKPHNLMRTPAGTIKILDFGLARFACEQEASSDGQITAVGAVMGTADYIAPEQAQDSRTADIRADIYSLGCTVYQLLANRVPFPGGTSMDKLVKHAVERPEPLEKLRSDLPPGLVQVVNKMMAKGAADRYQTPADVALALTPFRSAATPTQTKSPPPRRRWLIAAALLGLLVCAAAVVITVRTGRGEITIKTDDPDIEVVTRKNGDLVLIRDTKTGKTWDLDTKKLNLGLADDENGLRIELDGKKPFVLKRRDGSLAVSITGLAEKLSRRNPFDVLDVENPEAEDVKTFAATVKLPGDAKDANAEQWAPKASPGKLGSLDGEWASRWKGGSAGDDWVTGSATVRQVGDRVYILHKEESATYLIEAKLQGKSLLVGRYLAQREDHESAPWVGKIVNDERIDGAWTEGRWDLRRKIADKTPAAKPEKSAANAPATPRNPFGIPDVEDPDGGEVQAYAAKTKLPGGADDPNAQQWVAQATKGKQGSLDGDWFGRWKNNGETDWNYCKGMVQIKTIGDRVYILYTDFQGRFLVDTRRDGYRLIGREHAVHNPADSGPCVFKIVGRDRLDGAFEGGRLDFRRKLEGPASDPSARR